jgi:hypothetical protein
MYRNTLLSAAALALAASVASAGTTSVNFQSDSNLRGLGTFDGTASYDSSAAKLTLTLDNTSATKSVITGFAFDITGSDTAKLEQVSHDKWKDDAHKGVIKAKPFGSYEAGAALNGKFGFGASKKGIAGGSEKTFVFDVHGADAANLTVADFFSGPANKEIVASFAGFKHHKTDRAAGAMSSAITDGTTTNNNNNNTNLVFPVIDPPVVKGNDGPPNLGTGNNNGGATAVPLPPAAWAGIITLLGILALRRKLRAMFA